MFSRRGPKCTLEHERTFDFSIYQVTLLVGGLDIPPSHLSVGKECSKRDNRKEQLCAWVETVGTQGWWGTLIFSSYVGSGPASTVHPKKIKHFKHPKKYLKF